MAVKDRAFCLGVTGAGGFIGRRVVEMAVERGWRVVGYSRNPSREIAGCAEVRRFEPGKALDARGVDAVVHLAGESVLGVWTEGKRREIRDSRILGTRSVTEGLLEAGGGAVLVSASAIGYYGDTGEELINESAPAGKGFLAEVSRRWEEEAMKAEAAGGRVVLLRIGFVLGSTGGAMIPLRRVFRMGLGGRLGSGRQWMSLVHVDDVAGLALWAVENQQAVGAYNATMPEPVRNADFTRMVAGMVRRPAILHAPAWGIKLMLGELSTLLLDSHRIVPERALNGGYKFRYAEPTGGLSAVLSMGGG